MLECPACRTAYEGLTLCPTDGTALLPAEAISDDHDEYDDDDEYDDAGDSFVGLTLEGGINLVGIAGEGAMGTVYEAWQTQMERRVAVKMLRRDLAREPGFLERFMREARAVARLNHPNIVMVHTIGEVSGAPYIVMEFIEGETVTAEIERGPIHPVRTIRIARQIASALADAHAAGIIHRDLKPSNVLLEQRRRASDFVKLLDFGVAKLVDADATLTRDGFVFGTPAYLSPEQANGVDIDGRSDLYSLGVCMFEMLTKSLPFTGNQVQLLLAHARDKAPPIRDRVPALPAELAELVDSLLAKDPNDRPESAEAVADALDAMLGDDSPSPWASTALPTADWTAVDLPPAKSGQTAAVETAETKALGTAMVRRRPLLLGFAGLCLLLAGAGTAAAIFYGFGSGDLAITPGDPIPAGAKTDFDAPTEAKMLSQDGYSLWIKVPTEIQLGTYYHFTVDAWDPEGEPLAEPKLTALFKGPLGENPFDLHQTKPGNFLLQRQFVEPGSYNMRIYLPGLDEPIELQFHVGTGVASVD